MHTLGAVAVIENDGQVLMIRRNDLPVWALPGGGLDENETLADCCVREVKEETGLDVEVERLVGLYTRRRIPARPMDLMFVFACRVTGGALQVSAETSAVRYWPPQALPRNMPGWYEQYLTDALRGYAAPVWRNLTPPWVPLLVAWSLLRLRRLAQRLRRRSKHTANHWNLGAFVTLFDADGRVLLVLRRDHLVWNLPGGKVEPNETPWEAAVRETREETGLEIALQRLTGVYHKPSRREVVLNFDGRVVGGRLTPTAEGVESRYYPVDAWPDPTLPKHVARIHDSVARHAHVVFKVQAGAPGLQALRFGNTVAKSAE